MTQVSLCLLLARTILPEMCDKGRGGSSAGVPGTIGGGTCEVKMTWPERRCFRVGRGVFEVVMERGSMVAV